MELYTSTPFLVGLLIVIILVIAYYFYKKRHSPIRQTDIITQNKEDKSESTQAPSGKEEVEEGGGYTDIIAGVFDNESRKLTYDNIIPAATVKLIAEEHKEAGTLGRQWNRDGNYIYAFVKDAKYTSGYCPILIPPRSDNDPVKLHYDMLQPEIPVIMNMDEEKNFFQQYGKVLWWAAVIAFIIFMIMSSRGT